MSNTSFAALLRGTDSAGQRTFHFTSDWGQGRAIYGGLIGAALYKTMRGQVPTDRQLRAMTVAFIGPVAPEPATVTATVLRQGKSVTQVEARLMQHDQILATANASFGASRQSSIVVPGAPRPDGVQGVHHEPLGGAGQRDLQDERRGHVLRRRPGPAGAPAGAAVQRERPVRLDEQ